MQIFGIATKKTRIMTKKTFFETELSFLGVSVAEICKKEKVIMVFERDEPTMSKIFSKFV